MSATTEVRAPRGGAGGQSGRRRRRPRSGPVVVGALALFLAVLALLAVQMRRGGDPALGAGVASAPPRPRHVLVHRVVRRVVIVHVPAGTPAAAASAPPPTAVAPSAASDAPLAPPSASVVTRAS